jgi:hypothetical protein
MPQPWRYCHGIDNPAKGDGAQPNQPPVANPFHNCDANGINIRDCAPQQQRQSCGDVSLEICRDVANSSDGWGFSHVDDRLARRPFEPYSKLSPQPQRREQNRWRSSKHGTWSSASGP